MIDQARALTALKAVDFNWTTHVKRIWNAPTSDVAELHRPARLQILDAVDQLQSSEGTDSPLGQVIVGVAGSGKTHLLSTIRQQAAEQGVGFVLVDMTDVRNFWETVLQGYISSLREDSESGEPQFQLRQVIQHLLNMAGYPSVSAEKMAELPVSSLNKGINEVLTALNRQNPKATARFQDIVRALFLMNANDFSLSDVGYSWLNGLEIEEASRQQFRFKRIFNENLAELVEGLSWLLSLKSPWILAIDQLDAIVSQSHSAAGVNIDEDSSAEQRLAQSIINDIGNGLMGLRDKTLRTLTVVSCLRVNWNILRRSVVSSFQDRFQYPIPLMPVVQTEIASQLIARRLQDSYRKHGFEPPYPTWPFCSTFFEDIVQKGELPRQILQRCDQHRQKCSAEGEVSELTRFAEAGLVGLEIVDFTEIEQAFQAAQQSIDIAQATQEDHEDDILGQWLQIAGECLIWENPTPNMVDSGVDINFPGGHNYAQLHARVRLIYRDQGDREKHLCLRALLRSHHSAYRARLKAAMTTSGIDRALSFRRLMLVRVGDIPGGASTQQLTQQFTDAGGILAYPAEPELRVLGALHQLKGQNLPNFPDWLRQTRPVSQLPFLQATVGWLFGDAVDPVAIKPLTAGSASSASGSIAQKPVSDRLSAETLAPASTTAGNGHLPQPQPSPLSRPVEGLPIGRQLIGQQSQAAIAIPLEALTKHVVVLAGSGAGKTVLVRRLVEEAALQGIPAIVMDCANDLARMGDHWPAPPDTWSPEDQAKAEQYHQSTEVVVWTPGRESGNALNLSPLPDFAALANNPDELDQAIGMAQDSLQDIVAAGNSSTAQIKRGLLRTALEYFAGRGGSSLESFAEFLSELPQEASGNIAKASKRAQEMADLLNAQIAVNPLLRHSGAPLDPAILLGLHSSSTRLSIINCIGLPGLAQQQQFLNQLAMTLFTWIKRNPAPAGQPLRGLLVIDEAKDFLPSQQTTACKSSLIRLAAQARKYGLGLIFATQAPKSIDHNVIANCSTQFYGRANSPSAINVVREQLRQRGGDGQDIARLERGQFYVAAEIISSPVKITTPLCLSYHPSSPLDETAVLQRAKQARSKQRT